MMYRISIAVYIGILAGVSYLLRLRTEENLKYGRIKKNRVLAIIDPSLLPIWLTIIFILGAFVFNSQTAEEILFDFQQLLPSIGLYYAVLLILIPFLRRIISARACGALWLIPSFLYFVYAFALSELSPFYTLTIPRRYATAFLYIWLAGFIIIMGRYLISHCLLRRRLIKGAEKLDGGDAFALWKNLCAHHGIYNKIPLYISPDVETPMTVGCFRSTMFCILPQKQYSSDELGLIFKHELRHILRLDSGTKFLLTFLKAFCWFNPFAWFTGKRAAEDIELSCDEALLMNANEKEREFYASLLLQNAGNAPGFTTCLSASAESLRYRLKMIMSPKKRLPGVITIAVACGLLVMSVGMISIADAPTTFGSLFFDTLENPHTLTEVAISNSDRSNLYPKLPYGWTSAYGFEDEKVFDYLSSLSVQEVYIGAPQYSEQEVFGMSFYYFENVGDSQSRRTTIHLTDNAVTAWVYGKGNVAYILAEEVDWDYLYSLLDFDAENLNPVPYRPEMYYSFNFKHPTSVSVFTATSKTLDYYDTVTGERWDIPDFWQAKDYGGIHGRKKSSFDGVKITFDYPPKDGYYTILVESLNTDNNYMLYSTDYPDGIFPLAEFDAKYTVFGVFESHRNTTYEMEFYFEVEYGEF